jgi:peroxiredoxin
MTQLRDDYSAFQAYQTEVLVIVPNGPHMLKARLPELALPYPVLMDKGSKVAYRYSGVEKFWLEGTALAVLVDKGGLIRYIHAAQTQSEEPDNAEILRVLQEMTGR